MQVYKKDGKRLLIRACSDRMSGNGLKLQEGRFRLGIQFKQFNLGILEVFSTLNDSFFDQNQCSVSAKLLFHWNTLAKHGSFQAPETSYRPLEGLYKLLWYPEKRCASSSPITKSQM